MLPSMQELAPILILLLVIFGARKLPEIGAGLGKGIKEFKKSMKDIEEDEQKEEKKPLNAEIENEKTKDGEAN
ncbi:twin-arginine translocase TatA/TatE family subunit [Hippea jasoniae]|uniref:twin-arginine translocase TatA/TatE family subunit n=1 Tax=Hippea jasoniae TaxID=944479 RepID=UPI00054FA892|nr:twin-arginine translocase TatA/TatE family subunit [Hippea jasoniae]